MSPANFNYFLPLLVARTCGEWKERGMVDDCYAEIDPKEKEEYTEVYCDMHAMAGAGLTLLRKCQFRFKLTTIKAKSTTFRLCVLHRH